MSAIGFDCNGNEMHAGDEAIVVEDCWKVTAGQRVTIEGQFKHMGFAAGDNILALKGIPEFGVSGKHLRKVAA
ncbi:MULTISPECIES: hypothetical protein [unclassified Marinobacter]|uniref:hypothetical protein n=1 Tax=unclassified Marinobacter TaxID=83889 RepID=UPI0019259556|nr:MULTISPECIES: hypothetical protein [unclassified Marinobacter]MBL3825143.1 hypothetical protein [Marinobacter sp. MC3]MBL3893653.1 hypothetical protein [Marinobacter sp. MW3]